ncbi:MAG: cysteine desulfurase [Planctomycetales bacterium]|nr:cysteine desulfurase [Planctomycetales bacterium]
MRQIYLDYNATTPVAPTVFEAMRPFLTDHFGNPSSGHVLGRACSQAIEDARESVAMLLGAASDEIIFTGTGTEANNLALKGVCQEADRFAGHIVISSIEHPAVKEPASYLNRMGCQLTVVGTDERGIVDPHAVEAAIREDTKIVSIMHANNEIGSIQPIQEISKICRRHKVLLHTDAAQSIGKIRTDVDELGVDLLTLAGHKLYAPKGIGALYVRCGIPLQPVLHGAGHEQGLRPGTENTPYIVALGAAAKLAARSLPENADRIARLRNLLQSGLEDAIPGITFNGHRDHCLPNTLSVNFPRVSGYYLLNRCPEVLASTGAACHSGTEHISDTLHSIGLTQSKAMGTIRLSLGWNTSEEDVQRATSAMISAWESLTADA